ncbi:MAG: ABC transporter ATP-binding protein [Rhodospirillaceae bacterium]|nr:ABC transporter ATP-binding protein [Rhodospirillaceae bacterium]
MSTAAAAVEAKNVSKIFGAGVGEVRALDNVSVTIRQNEFFTLLGPSGCGKTTLLRLIAGFEMPTEGSILLEGEEVAHLPPFKRPVNTVFQNYALFPHMSVAENIGFGLEMLGKPKTEVQQTVDAMLRLVRMEELKHRKTSQISGGQQQRVALARALAPRPKVLLLDEPLSALDYKLRKDMQLELKRMQHETGITFIFVTHDQEEALTMSDRIAVMSQGNILQIGSPDEIYERPADRFVADFIGETNFIEAEVIERIGEDGRIRLPSGVAVSHKLASNAGVGSRVTLAIRPERIDLVRADGETHLKGKVDNIVYFGTDTTFHVGLDSGQSVTVRVQNRRGHQEILQVGDVVGLTIAPEAMQILRD